MSATFSSGPVDVIRRCRFSPYRRGLGLPTFNLVVWDTFRTINGHSELGYRLTMRNGPVSVVLFEGEDFGCSPMYCIDSDETVASLMSFLTLRPGDTDAEYFADYSAAQLEYCAEHAEALSSEVYSRFGDC